MWPLKLLAWNIFSLAYSRIGWCQQVSTANITVLEQYSSLMKVSNPCKLLSDPSLATIILDTLPSKMGIV